MRIETKFSPGQKVWAMEGSEPAIYTVSSVNTRCYENSDGLQTRVSYTLSGRFTGEFRDGVDEPELFQTRTELLKMLYDKAGQLEVDDDEQTRKEDEMKAIKALAAKSEKVQI